MNNYQCLSCGKNIELKDWFAKNGLRKYCSIKCQHNYYSGSNSPQWKGGEIVKDGYVFVRMPRHPRSNNNYVQKHIVVMEKFLGRFVLESEVVHHIDGNTENNDIDNLLLFKSENEHRRWHAEQRIRLAGGNPEVHKICWSCRKLKKKDEFHKSRNGWDGHSHTCKVCTSELSKTRRMSHERITVIQSLLVEGIR